MAPDRLLAARDWHRHLAGSEAASGVPPRFRDIDGRIEQPALLENVLCLHLGGAKRTERRQGRSALVRDVPVGGLTIMPAGEAFRWRTEGPIDFAHVTLDQAAVERVAAEEFDREPAGLRLRDVVGVVDPPIRALAAALARDAAAPARLRREGLLAMLARHLVSRWSNRAALPRRAARGGLADWQLRRVLAHIRANLAEDLGLDELVTLTGLSRAQFFRGFRRSTGRTPYAYVTDLRIAEARCLLDDRSLRVGEVASRVGLGEKQLAVAFRCRLGLSPTAWRREALS